MGGGDSTNPRGNAIFRTRETQLLLNGPNTSYGMRQNVPGYFRNVNWSVRIIELTRPSKVN